MTKIITLLFAVLAWHFSFGQKTVSGTITDPETKETLPSVNVVVKGTTTGTVTDMDGKYSITLPEGSNVLVFSFLGYEDKEVTVGEGANITVDVVLKTSNIDLNAVVISASRRQEKILDAPASISVIDAKQIENNVSLTPVDNLKSTPGVDIIQTGLTSSNVTLRGFNNIFSGALLVMVDNRIGHVPSLRFNAYNLIPTTDDDIERMEVLRGPASALYGPNSSSGVLHMITKSPLDLKTDFETKVSFLGGIERKVIAPHFRHAQKIGKKFGYKISGGYFQGNDWEYIDSVELENGPYLVLGRQTKDGRELTDDTIPNVRDNDLQRYNFDGRIDIRPINHMEIILSGGFNNASGVELTGIGGTQAKNWKTYYGQLRFTYKDLFAQFFVNGSNAGDTYLLRSADLIVDKSKFYVGQIQHSYSPLKWMRFIYGVDALLTRPNTGNTINGRNEEDDAINEIGGYLQGNFDVHKKLTLLGAVRIDKHNFVDKVFVSPRGAIVYKPDSRNTLRFTYNRAFSSPSSNNLNLDILQAQLPAPIPQLQYDIKTFGNRGGYTFPMNEGLPQYLSFFADSVPGYSSTTYVNLNDPVMADVAWSVARQGVSAQFKEYLLSDSSTAYLVPLVDAVLGAIAPSSLNGEVKNELKALNLTTASFEKINTSDVVNLDPVVNDKTTTYEVGYKGFLFNRLMLNVDFYVTNNKNFVSPVTLITPNVFLEQASMEAYLRPHIDSALNANPLFNSVLTSQLDSLAEFGGDMDGNPLNELVGIFLTAGGQIPYGVVTPSNEGPGPQMIVTYVNIGDITIFGMDIGINLILTKDLRFGAAYSFVNKNKFELEGAQFGYISLNAPKNKLALTLDYDFDKIGLNAGLRYRWNQGFLANSGAYVGEVDDYHTLDLTVGYKFWFSRNTRLDVSVTNLVGTKYNTFPGTAQIGRHTMIRVSHTFTGKGQFKKKPKN